MSTENVEIQESDQEKKPAFQEQLEALEIPSHIDPRLFALWLEREREELEKPGDGKIVSSSKGRQTRKLSRIFAAYVGIVAMCVVITLGLFQGKETVEILTSACKTFLFYVIFGFFAGWIAETCIKDSVETMLREIVHRSEDSVHKEPEMQHSEISG